MSAPIFDPDDYRLTAYALGELTEATDRADVERFLRDSPEARAALEETRALCGALVAEYDDERRAADLPAADDAPVPGKVVALESHPAVAARRQRRHWLGLAAALVALGALFGLSLVELQRDAGRTAHNYSTPTFRAKAAPPANERASSHAIETKRTERFAYTAPEPAAQRRAIALPTPSTVTPLPPVPRLATSQEGLGLADNAPAKLPLDVVDAAPVPELVIPSETTPGAVGGGRATAAARSGAVPASPASGSVSGMGMGAGFGGGAGGNGVRVAGAKDSRSLFFQGAHTYAGTTTVNAGTATMDAEMSKDFRGIPATAPDDSNSAEPLARLKTLAKPGAFNTASYAHLVENDFLAARDNPLSTFSIDVDTASYSNTRRFIENGSLPPPDAVRVEEMLNYFPYHDAPPAPDDKRPFAIHLEAAACPWAPDHRLVRIGIKGREMAVDKRPASNLVFLLDVSGSMTPPERLPLIKDSLRLMVEKLTPEDRVAIVVYAGESGLALPSTTGGHKDRILAALDNLHAGGSTNGAAGIELAYKTARDGFIKGGTNRVILATDGDFNVGTTSEGDLVRLIEKEAKSGVFLSVLGVGDDNFKDSTMQKLADRGNGNYAYLDKLEEGRKALVEQLSCTLVTIAKDVKIQVEFNPATVAAYRLIGYEKRMLKKEDFNNDKIDAGEIGAGHHVTALYEVVPVGAPLPAPAVDALKYQPASAPAVAVAVAPGAVPVVRAASAPPPPSDAAMVTRQPAGELLTVKMRHKAPDADTSERTLEESLTDRPEPGGADNASEDFRFAAAVASFGMVLRDSPHKGSATLATTLDLAQSAKGEDPGGYRAGFLDLVHRAQDLMGKN